MLNLYPANGMNPRTGYGRAEIGIANGLQSAGVNVQLANPSWQPFPDAPTLVIGYPTWAERFPKRTRLWSYTMSETDRVSDEWVDVINRRYERVFVPCPALVDVYRASGVTVPVESVGLPMDTFEPPFRLREWSKDEPFVFLTYTLGDVRKGANYAVMAFVRQFRGDQRFKLLVKAPDYDSWIDGCADDQIEVVRGSLNEGQWHALLERAHCFVFSSLGEGFGMPPREATLAGVPAIATAWLGMADVECWGYPIPVARLQPCVFDSYEANARGAQWSLPDDLALGERMRWVVDHYGEAALQAVRGRDYLRQTCSGLAVAAPIAVHVEATR